MNRLLIIALVTFAMTSCKTVDYSSQDYNETEMQWAETLGSWYSAWDAPALLRVDNSPSENPPEPTLLIEEEPIMLQEIKPADSEQSNAPADMMGISLVGGTYTVSKGDTLSSIAKKNGTTVNALLKANPSLSKGSVLKIGQTIVTQ